MRTIKITIPSAKHLVSLAGNDYDLPANFIYHLKDRGNLFKFRFKKYDGKIPPNGEENFRVGDRIHGVRLNPDSIQGRNLKAATKADPDIRSDIYEVSSSIDLEYFPTDTRKIIINSAGYEGNLHGIKNNFLKIGRLMGKEKCGSFVIYQHTGFWNLLDNALLALESISSDLQDVIDFCNQNSFKISKSGKPKLYLSGFSMGGGAAAITGAKNPDVEKMLLIAPSPEKREDLIVKWLGEYRGEIYFVHGQRDGIISWLNSKNFAKAAKKAKKVELVTIKNCDHRFTGEDFQKEFIQSYSRVFANDN